MNNKIKYEGTIYFSDKYIAKEKPYLTKNGLSGKAMIIKNNIDIDNYTYFKLKDNKIVETEGTSKKFDKLYIKKSWYDALDDEPEKEDIDVIKMAPSQLELNDNEKFKDDKGNILDIKVYGEKEYDKIYFTMTSVSREFNLKSLQVSMLNKTSLYEKGIHYKYFYLNKFINNEKNKNKPVKKMFITYLGMLKILFTTKNKKCDGFIKWATETLFISQMGTKEQRERLVSNILSIDNKVVKTVFNLTGRDTSVMYLIELGTVKKLRKKFNIPTDIDDNEIVYKFGYTDNLTRRFGQHDKYYSTNYGIKISLKYFAYIDPTNLSSAETDIKSYFESTNMKLKHVTYKEICIVPDNKLKHVKKQYDTICKAYSGCMKDVVNELETLKHSIELKDAQINNLIKDLAIKDKELELKDKDLEIANLKLQMQANEINKLKKKK
jgi:uncharacterized protein YsxB (DUF464 family)